ncbi:MAG: PA4642 family protein [Gammaproteobacteria bacterium]|nr:PA4642 family protein [Gammaproteobacteria bacterium]
MSGPTQPAVHDEEWSDERVRDYLFSTPYQAGVDPDHHVLLRAYRAMRAEDFKRFLVFFAEAGRNINARDAQGNTLLDDVSRHAKGQAYAEALRAQGAKAARELG